MATREIWDAEKVESNAGTLGRKQGSGPRENLGTQARLMATSEIWDANNADLFEGSLGRKQIRVKPLEVYGRNTRKAAGKATGKRRASGEV
ncbi:MAG: hypothetical protein JNL64_01430 [Blastocatellia bacterium]|nr:hypothetical protein [Blastocatellia bacterium]